MCLWLCVSNVSLIVCLWLCVSDCVSLMCLWLCVSNVSLIVFLWLCVSDCVSDGGRHAGPERLSAVSQSWCRLHGGGALNSQHAPVQFDDEINECVTQDGERVFVLETKDLQTTRYSNVYFWPFFHKLFSSSILIQSLISATHRWEEMREKPKGQHGTVLIERKRLVKAITLHDRDILPAVTEGSGPYSRAHLTIH